jgi:hypothetical protein
MKLLNGHLLVPVASSHFGDYLNLEGLIPVECDCVMVMVNTGGGLNAGYPQPVGFLKLSHQLYVRDINEMIERWHLQQDNAQSLGRPDLWRITVAPVRSAEFVNLWEAGKQ